MKKKTYYGFWRALEGIELEEARDNIDYCYFCMGICGDDKCTCSIHVGPTISVEEIRNRRFKIKDRQVSKEDICKKCNSIGEIKGMACVCKKCNNVIWGC